MPFTRETGCCVPEASAEQQRGGTNHRPSSFNYEQVVVTTELLQAVSVSGSPQSIPAPLNDSLWKSKHHTQFSIDLDGTGLVRSPAARNKSPPSTVLFVLDCQGTVCSWKKPQSFSAGRYAMKTRWCWSTKCLRTGSRTQ